MSILKTDGDEVMSVRRSYSSYNDGCAAAHALDLIGERWALIVVRELLLGPTCSEILSGSAPLRYPAASKTSNPGES